MVSFRTLDAQKVYDTPFWAPTFKILAKTMLVNITFMGSSTKKFSQTYFEGVELGLSLILLDTPDRKRTIIKTTAIIIIMIIIFNNDNNNDDNNF